MQKKTLSLNLIIFIIGISLSFLCLLSIGLNYTISWLKYQNETQQNVTVGGVDLELWGDGTNISNSVSQGFSVTLSTVNTAVPINLKARNVGTLSGIVRVQMAIYYLNASNQMVAVNSSLALVTNTGWINEFVPTTYSGNSYYNSLILPYGQSSSNEVSIISSITPTNSIYANATIIIVITEASILEYQSNPYKNSTGTPWGTLPSGFTAYQ